MKYFHVDVFSSEPLKGNGLTVVFADQGLSDSRLLNITREFRQFETIFIYQEEDDIFPARIFTVDEELDFAGHPVLGAAAVIKFISGRESAEEIRLRLKNRIISTTAVRNDDHFIVSMNQGRAEFIESLKTSDAERIIESLNLEASDIHPDYPIEVVSTGLSYLLLPAASREALGRAGINVPDFEELLKETGAKFIYIFCPDTLECRTWDNLGRVEDAATGSAAGPLAAYLVKNGFREKDQTIVIRQGDFAGRPGYIETMVKSGTDEVVITGAVSFFGKGEIL